ncbi:hypothetical protein BSPWISOXPB_101 [uncultured Gammaproteobacteria bacterium]|nr:hypothetical protein BSPWISOXPB_101 [uncultured Gammaproteobacteria bacterium]
MGQSRRGVTQNRGGTGAPAGSGYTKIYSTKSAFAAIKADGSIAAWGPHLMEVQRPPLIL